MISRRASVGAAAGPRRARPPLVQDEPEEARQPRQDLVGRGARREQHVAIDATRFRLAKEAFEHREIAPQKRGVLLVAREQPRQPPQVVVRGMLGANALDARRDARVAAQLEREPEIAAGRRIDPAFVGAEGIVGGGLRPRQLTTALALVQTPLHAHRRLARARAAASAATDRAARIVTRARLPGATRGIVALVVGLVERDGVHAHARARRNAGVEEDAPPLGLKGAAVEATRRHAAEPLVVEARRHGQAETARCPVADAERVTAAARRRSDTRGLCVSAQPVWRADDAEAVVVASAQWSHELARRAAECAGE